MLDPYDLCPDAREQEKDDDSIQGKDFFLYIKLLKTIPAERRTGQAMNQNPCRIH